MYIKKYMMFNIKKNFFFLILFFYTNANANFNQDIEDLKSKLSNLQHELRASSIFSIYYKNNFFNYSSNQTEINSQFYIGSVSKHFTAYIFLYSLKQLYPDRELEKILEYKLLDIFPQSSILKKINSAWINDITLVELLTHKSGLSNYIDAFNNTSIPPEELNKPIKSEKLLKLASYDNKKTYLYSNTNYLLLAKLIEEMQDKSFNQIFDELVKKPAKMFNSFAPIEGNYFNLKKEKSYEKLTINLNNKIFIDMANTLGAGNIISTADDLLKWGIYLFRDSPKNVLSTMIKNYGIDYDEDIINLGLSTTETGISSSIGFQGALDSYKTFFGYWPLHDLLIVILSNDGKVPNFKIAKNLSDFIQMENDIIYINIFNKKLHYKLLDENTIVHSSTITESQLAGVINHKIKFPSKLDEHYLSTIQEAVLEIIMNRNHIQKNDYDKLINVLINWISNSR